MGVIVTKEDEQSSKLNERITADLREKAQATTKIMDPDLVEGSEYTKSMKKTGRFAWIWIILVILAGISLFIIFST